MSVVRRSPAQWRELVAGWQLSGSTLTDFCSANVLNPETFNRLRGQVSRPAAPTRLTLVPVALAPTAGFATLGRDHPSCARTRRFREVDRWTGDGGGSGPRPNGPLFDPRWADGPEPPTPRVTRGGVTMIWEVGWIVVDPAVFSGKPIIRGRRLAVEHVPGMLAAGDDPNTILAGYPLARAG